MRLPDTIFAPATAAGRAAVAMIRISGPQAMFALERLAGPLPPPRQASLRKIRNADTGEVLDQALALWFPGPRSFTGEDCAEIHVHGGRAIVAGVLRLLAKTPGLRPAEPGEFTRRAFMLGRLDLAQAEGLSDLIDSETELQRRQALHQFEGGLGRKVARWREALLGASALVEAQIDFSEEEDVPGDVIADVRAIILPVGNDLHDALASSHAAQLVRDGVYILIAGPPNVGKSSLLNYMAQRDVAIVSPFAGTTRDILELHLSLQGAAAVLIDSAGLRDAADPIEREGIERARRRARSVDIILWLAECGGAFDEPPELVAGQQIVRVATKADRIASVPVAADHVVSVHTGAGMQGLLDDLGARVSSMAAPVQSGVLTRERHRLACERALVALNRIGSSAMALELAGEDLRVALRALESLIGAVDVEDVLGEIFSRFCIGK